MPKHDWYSTDSLKCPKCGGKKNGAFTVCWRCHMEEQKTAAYREGYREGMKNGARQGARTHTEYRVQIETRRLRQLIQLCHPDKHGNSATANDITQWLLAQRE